MYLLYIFFLWLSVFVFWWYYVSIFLFFYYFFLYLLFFQEKTNAIFRNKPQLEPREIYNEMAKYMQKKNKPVLSKYRSYFNNTLELTKKQL